MTDETAVVRAPPLTIYLAQSQILDWAKKQQVTRRYRKKSDDPEIGKSLQWVEDELDDGTQEPNGYVIAQRTDSPSISRATFFKGVDDIVVQWINQYAEQLMTWNYRSDVAPFAQLRVTKVEATLRTLYPNASTPTERRRLIRNICGIVSAAISFACADLANTNTLTIKTPTVLNFLNWHTAMVFQPLKNGAMTLQQEDDAYDELIPKRERKAAAPAEEPAAAEEDEPAASPEPAKKRSKKRAAETEPAAAKKRAKKAAEADDFSGPVVVAAKQPVKPAMPKAPKSKAESAA